MYPVIVCWILQLSPQSLNYIKELFSRFPHVNIPNNIIKLFASMFPKKYQESLPLPLHSIFPKKYQESLRLPLNNIFPKKYQETLRLPLHNIFPKKYQETLRLPLCNIFPKKYQETLWLPLRNIFPKKYQESLWLPLHNIFPKKYQEILRLPLHNIFPWDKQWNSQICFWTPCCAQGKVMLPLLAPPPEPLRWLLTSNEIDAKDFRQHIRSYNNALAFTFVFQCCPTWQLYLPSSQWALP